MNIIDCHDISMWYQRGALFGRQEHIDVFKNISFSIPAGRCVGLIGSRGAGKSTLGRLVLGLDKPKTGTISFMGKDIRMLGPKEKRSFRRQVQVVFQNVHGSVNPAWTVEQIVAEPLDNFEPMPKRGHRERIVSLLEMVGLVADDAGKRPHQFSGGQLQRVCIARAIACSPSLIILDEAVSSLDMVVQSRILDLLQDLRTSSGMGYLLISHDLRVITRMCETVHFLHGGTIAQTLELDGAAGKHVNAAFCEFVHSSLGA